MSFFDKVRGKAQQAAAKNSGKLQQGIDKAAKKADQQTGGKYSEQIRQKASKAKEFTEEQARQGQQGQQGSHGQEGQQGSHGQEGEHGQR